MEQCGQSAQDGECSRNSVTGTRRGLADIACLLSREGAVRGVGGRENWVRRIDVREAVVSSGVTSGQMARRHGFGTYLDETHERSREKSWFHLPHGAQMPPGAGVRSADSGG